MAFVRTSLLLATVVQEPWRHLRRSMALAAPARRDAVADLIAFGHFLSIHRDAQLVCVAGDSASLLPLLYQHLPFALEKAAEETGPYAAPVEVRLVSHEVAGKGLQHAQSSPDRYVVVMPSTASANGVTNAVAAADSTATIAARWCVPRFVVDTTNLDRMLTLWSAGGTSSPAQSAAAKPQTIHNAPTSVQVIFFVNTDIADASLINEGNYGGGLAALQPPHAPPDGKMSINPDRQLLPVFRLTARSPFLDWRTQKALTALDRGVDPSTLFRLAVSAACMNALLPQQTVGGWRGSVACTGSMAHPHFFPQPRLYGSAAALAKGLQYAAAQNAADAAVVEQLHEIAQLPAVLTGKRAGGPTTTTPPAIHRYYPLVIDVDESLRTRCCLSDVFVFELARDGDRGSMIATAAGCATPQERTDALAEATAAYLLHGGPDELHRVERCLGGFVRALASGRRAFSWSASDQVMRVPRVAVCFSHEFFSELAVQPLLAEERRLTAADTVTDGLCEEELPTSMSFLVRAVTRALRARGWVLVDQDAHHSWDSASTASVVVNANPLQWAAASAVKEDDLARRVLRGADDANWDKQRAAFERSHSLWQGRQQYRPRTPYPDSNKDKSDFRDESMPSGYTSLELWQAALVPETRGEHCLALWRGARVSLPNGRGGVVVDFAPIPAWVTEDGGRDGHDLASGSKSLAHWLRSPRNQRWRWKPSLPAYLAEAEREVWPVVQFRHRERPTLVMPLVVQRHHIGYPTRCFVSAAQQRAIAAAALPPSTIEKDLQKAAKSKSGRLPMSHPHHLHRRHNCQQLAFRGEAEEIHDVSWSLDVAIPEPVGGDAAAKAAWVDGSCVTAGAATTAALPLLPVVGETPESLFYAYALLDGGADLWCRRIRAPRDGGGLARRQRLQVQWRELHIRRRAEILLDGSMGGVAPSTVSLRHGKRDMQACGFLERPRALWCVVVCLPRLNLVTVDSPSMLALLAKKRASVLRTRLPEGVPQRQMGFPPSRPGRGERGS